MNKKIILIAAAAVLSFIFASCGEKGPVGPSGTDTFSVMNIQDGVYPSDVYAGTTDAQIRLSNPTVNYGTAASGWVGSWLTLAERTMIKFDISGLLPAGATITNAYLTLHTSAYDGSGATVTAYKLTAPFVEANTTWNDSATATPWTAAGGDYGAAAISDSVHMRNEDFYTLKLNVDMVKSWYTTPSTNYGIILKGADEAASNDVYVDTKNNGTAEFRPRLTIYYK